MKLAPQEIRTFFVTASTWGRRTIFRAAPLAELFLKVCFEYRNKKKFELHEFVLMPDHFHMILTPDHEVPLEKVMQFIKGGYSYRVKKELGWNTEIWSTGFSEHRIKDPNDYENHRQYIFQNPVRKGLADQPHEYLYSSATGKYLLDAAPPALKRTLKGAAVSPG